jgi:hypothetical protein
LNVLGFELHKRKRLPILLGDQPHCGDLISAEGGADLVFGCTDWNESNESSVTFLWLRRSSWAHFKFPPIHFKGRTLGDRFVVGIARFELNKPKTTRNTITVLVLAGNYPNACDRGNAA